MTTRSALSAPRPSDDPARGRFSRTQSASSLVRTPHPPTVLRRGSDVGRLLGDRYILLDWIGRGGMADVFLARDCHTGRFVAIKMLAREHRSSPLHRKRMARELVFTRLVAHKYVIRLLDSGCSEDDLPFLVLDGLVGETLHEYLRREQTMPADQALKLIRQLGEALMAVHAARVVHGDVKPHNVFLSGPIGQPTHVTLLDFGLARSVGEGGECHDDTVMGTIEYMAPEQVLADPVDARTDIYAFGVLAFRWLTGELPFDTGSDTAMLVHHIFSPAPPVSWLLRDVDPRLEAVISLSVKKAPENRYQCMADLLRDLDDSREPSHAIEAGSVVPDGYTPKTSRAEEVKNLLGRAHLTS